jgi:Methionine synthase I (cobalamin-dependent), methyltransferase domain
VAGSVGPTGEFIEPLGSVSESEMYDVFTEQIIALEKGGADAVMIETQMAIEEAEIAIKATKENTNLLIFSSMVFDKGPRGFFTMMGITPESAVQGMLEAGPDVVWCELWKWH